MPDSFQKQEQDLSRYDTMPDDQLRQILRSDASKTEGDVSDMEAILYVMEVLARRRSERNESKDPEKALESFDLNYRPKGSDAKPAQKRTGVIRLKRSLAVVAAVVALVIFGTVTAGAFGFDIWETVAKWTKETFYFGSGMQTEPSEPSVNDATPYKELQELLDEQNVQVALAPTWIPDGYESVEVMVQETPKQRQFVAVHQNGENFIKVQIKDYLGGFPEQIEQSDALVEIHQADGVDYYIFKNEDQLRAAWINENYECYISGSLTISEIKDMINSIAKGRFS